MRVSEVLGTRSVLLAGITAALSCAAMAGPTGAKAIFDSGSGGATIGMSVNAPIAAPAATESATGKYVGISYQILAIEDDGQMRPVSKNRVFRSGERVKVLASTNRPGYLTVANIGTSGRMNVLFSEYVDAHKLTQIPPNSNLRFDNNPGTENLLIMLSNEPSPFVAPGAGRQMVSAPAPAAPPPPPQYQPATYSSPSTAQYAPPPAMPSESMPPPPPMPDPMSSSSAYAPLPTDQASATMVASLEGAKSLKARGAKDLMVEDQMESSYAVVSPRQGFKAVSGGAKDLIMESTADGQNYGMVPTAAIASGGILTLEIKLKHR